MLTNNKLLVSYLISTYSIYIIIFLKYVHFEYEVKIYMIGASYYKTS